MHRVQEFRLKYGWEQAELADKAGLSTKVISNIENNQDYDCQRNTMICISRAFALPPSVIFFPEEEKESRKMLSAIISVCIKNVDESQVYETLQHLKNHRNSSAQDGDPLASEECPVLPPSSEAQPSAAPTS